MNIAVGKITDEARVAIQAVGGSIEGTLKPEVSMVVLPDSARAIEIDGTSQCIVIPGDKGTTLVFHRGWETEDCSLDILHKATARPDKTSIHSLRRCLRRYLPTQRVRPGEALVLWFGEKCKQWITIEEALQIVENAYPLGDRDAYQVPGYAAIYIYAADRSAYVAFYTE